MAFFFGEGHHLDAEGQAPALLVQRTHTGHGCQYPQAAVVLATVTNRVVMAAGQQPLGRPISAVVEPDDIADRVDAGLVKAAVFTHPVLELAGAGPVRVAQVGDSQLAALGIARVTVGGQLLGPVPYQVTEFWRVAKFVTQPDLCNAVDIAQGFGEFEVGVMAKPALEGGKDIGLAEPQAAGPADRQNEGKAELGAVIGIELPDARQLSGGAVGQAGLGLLVRGLGGQGVGCHGLAGEFWVGPDQAQLGGPIGLANHLNQGIFELSQSAKRAPWLGALSNPGGVFIHTRQQTDEFCRCGGIEVFNGEGHSTCSRSNALNRPQTGPRAKPVLWPLDSSQQFRLYRTTGPGYRETMREEKNFWDVDLFELAKLWFADLSTFFRTAVMFIALSLPVVLSALVLWAVQWFRGGD